MADADRAEALREVPEPVLGHATKEIRPVSGNGHSEQNGNREALQAWRDASVVPLRGMSEVSLYDQWEAEFKPLLGKTGRWEGFCYIVKDLLSREKPVMLETGTLREPGNWKGDGQSTRLWSWIQEKKGGAAISVDLDNRACMAASRECPNVHVICQDSVSFLRGFQPFAIDLLYLDSFDANFEGAAMHQLAELSAIWDRLPAGCLVASDDQHDKDHGKPVLTRRLLHIIGIEPVLDSYVIVWKKP